MAELADAADSKSAEVHPSWGFDPPSRHHSNARFLQKSLKPFFPENIPLAFNNIGSFVRIGFEDDLLYVLPEFHLCPRNIRLRQLPDVGDLSENEFIEIFKGELNWPWLLNLAQPFDFSQLALTRVDCLQKERSWSRTLRYRCR